MSWWLIASEGERPDSAAKELPPPEVLELLRDLDPTDATAFITDVVQALTEARTSDDWRPLLEVVARWSVDSVSLSKPGFIARLERVRAGEARLVPVADLPTEVGHVD